MLHRRRPGAALSLLAALAFAAPARALDFAPIAPGHYLVQGPVEDWGPANQGLVSNVGLIVGSRCAALVDSGGSPAAGRALLEAARRVTPLPLCWVINTHAHPDHVLGNEAFAQADPKTLFVGHARLAAALDARGPYYRNALKRDFGTDAAIVRPTVPVADQLQLDLGGRTLELTAWPTAHTDADLTVYDPATRTLWLGDLLFVSHLPVLDGKLLGWLAVGAQLARIPAAVAVPGHGAPSAAWPAALEPQTRYLEQLRDELRRDIKAGASLAQAVERSAAPADRWQLTATFHKRNVTAAFAELEWE